MKDKYVVLHDISAWQSVKSFARRTAYRVQDFTVPPLQAHIRFCFIAGCGHTGTTLLAAKLGNHEAAFLVPEETNLFSPSKKLNHATAPLARWGQQAREDGASVVLEKTPKHVHLIQRIRRSVHDVRFILMLRNPLDACASLSLRFGSLKFATERWNMDTQAVLDRKDDEDVLVILYEQLVADPESTLLDAVNFLGLPYSHAMLQASGSTYDCAVGLEKNMQLRRNQVAGPIRNNNGKWRQTLSEDQARYVLRRTRRIALNAGYTEDSVFRG